MKMKAMSIPIDAMIPIGPNDLDISVLSARSVRAFVEGVRKIYVVARHDPGIDGTHFIDEAAFPFDIQIVRTILNEDARAGWYLQQLIKLYFPLVVPDCVDHVLAIDADTIFLRPSRFIDNKRVVFNLGDEYHEPYFEHMRRMHPSLQKLIDYSGITHCMMFNRRWLAELMNLVETHHRQVALWKVYLAAVAPKHRKHSGASEYETYFNFCLCRHPEQLIIRRFHWRNVETSDEVRPDLHDYVSLHWHQRQNGIDYDRLAAVVFPPGPD
jgi:Family of unknown function (DUF6492)